MNSITRYVTLAMSQPRLLTVLEFIKVVGYPIDCFAIDRFWNSMREGRYIYVDDEIIQWMGYSSADASVRKKHFMKQMRRMIRGVDYVIYTHDQYTAFREEILSDSMGSDKNEYSQTGAISPIVTDISRMDTCAETAHTESSSLCAERSTLSDSMGSDKNTHMQKDMIDSVYPPPAVSRGLRNREYLLLTAKCLKTTMMRVDTAKGDQVREYYFALEELIKVYIEYQSRYRLKEARHLLESEQSAKHELAAQLSAKDLQLAAQSNKLLGLENFMENVKLLEKKQYIYIATSAIYAKSNHYKVGRTTNLRSRISTYNTGRADSDNMYYCWIYTCHDATQLEARIKSLLQHVRSTKNREMCILHYDVLQPLLQTICERDNMDTDDMNAIVRNYREICSRDATPPRPLLEHDGIKLPGQSILNKTDVQAIDFAPFSHDVPPAHICEAVDANVAATADTNVAATVDTNVAATVDANVAATAENANTEQPDTDDTIYICTVQLTKIQARAIVERVLAKFADREITKRQLGILIRAALPHGKKTKFRAKEWIDLIASVARELRVVIRHK